MWSVPLLSDEWPWVKISIRQGNGRYVVWSYRSSTDASIFFKPFIKSMVKSTGGWRYKNVLIISKKTSTSLVINIQSSTTGVSFLSLTQYPLFSFRCIFVVSNILHTLYYYLSIYFIYIPAGASSNTTTSLQALCNVTSRLLQIS